VAPLLRTASAVEARVLVRPRSLLTYAVAVTFAVLLGLTALRGAKLLLVDDAPSAPTALGPTADARR
jgi:hypothetical protein